MSNPTGLKAFVYTVALFLAGGVCGVMVAPRIFPPAQNLKVGRIDEIAAKIQTKLENGLRLTPDEVTKALPLIRDTSQKLEDAHFKCLTQIELDIRQLHQDLRPILTADQISALQDLDTQREKTMKQKYNFVFPPRVLESPAMTNQPVH